MPELCTPYILLEKSAIDVIVGWVTVHPLVEHHGIKREPPVVRRRMVCMIIAFTGIVQGTDCLLIGIQVVLSIGWIIAKSLGYRGRKQEMEERHGSKRQVPTWGKRRMGPTKGVQGGSVEKKRNTNKAHPKFGGERSLAVQIHGGSRYIRLGGECLDRQGSTTLGRGSGLTASHIGRLNLGLKGLASRPRL